MKIPGETNPSRIVTVRIFGRFWLNRFFRYSESETSICLFSKWIKLGPPEDPGPGYVTLISFVHG